MAGGTSLNRQSNALLTVHITIDDPKPAMHADLTHCRWAITLRCCYSKWYLVMSSSRETQRVEVQNPKNVNLGKTRRSELKAEENEDEYGVDRYNG